MVAGSERQYGLSLLVTCQQNKQNRTVQWAEVCPDCGYPVNMSDKSDRSRDENKSKSGSGSRSSSRESSVDSASDSETIVDAIVNCPDLTPIETWTESEYSKLSAANKKLANNVDIIMGNISSIRNTVNSIAEECNSLIKHVKTNTDRVRDIDYEHGH